MERIREKRVAEAVYAQAVLAAAYLLYVSVHQLTRAVDRSVC